MKIRWTGIIGLFAAVLLSGLAINIPVTQVLRLVALPPQVGFAGLQGSIIQGSVNRLEIKGYPFYDINFQMKPLCLLKLALCYQLIDEESLELNLERHLFTRDLDITNSRVPIDEALFDTIPNLIVKPTGTITANVESLSITGQQKLDNLAMTLSWENAGISGEEQVLGNYVVEITQVESGFKARVMEGEGLLQMSGDGKIDWSGQYAVNMDLNTGTALKDSIKSALELIAKKTDLNRFKLKRSGRLKSSELRVMNQLKPNK